MRCLPTTWARARGGRTMHAWQTEPFGYGCFSTTRLCDGRDGITDHPGNTASRKCKACLAAASPARPAEPGPQPHEVT